MIWFIFLYITADFLSSIIFLITKSLRRIFRWVLASSIFFTLSFVGTDFLVNLSDPATYEAKTITMEE